MRHSVRRDKPRVLVLAEECNPDMVSVPLEGWSHYRALSKIVDAHLVTQIRNRDAILSAGLVERRDVTFIDTEPLARPLFRLRPLLGAAGGKGWTVITALQTLQYPYFEQLTWDHFGPQIRARHFDIVHRLIPLSPTAPSLLARKCHDARVPFLLGPLNGGLKWPAAFTRERHREREFLSYLRGLYKLMPGYHDTWRHAAAAIIGSRDTWSQVPRQYLPKCVYIPENGFDPARFSLSRPPHRHTPGTPLRVTFVGRLVPYKGPDMLLEAAAPLARQNLLSLDIVGDGPLRPDLERLIQREGLHNQVTLSGWTPHTQIQQKLASSDLFAFPSIREFGGAVVLEAMATGVPPLVIDYGGPAEIVTNLTGFLVKMGSRSSIIAAFRSTLEQLCRVPTDLEPRAQAAKKRAHELFTWEAKSLQTLEVYHWLLGRTEKPHHPSPLPDPEPSPTPSLEPVPA